MSLIKLATRTAPSISQSLLDARVGNRKYLGVGTAETQQMPWSGVEKRFEAVLADAVDHLDQAPAVMAIPHRFTPPLPALRMLPPPLPLVPIDNISDRALEWASSQDLMLQRAASNNDNVNHATALLAFLPSDPQEPVQYRVSALKFVWTSMLVRVHPPTRLDGAFELIGPLEIVNTIDVFARLHEGCHAGGHVTIRLHPIEYDTTFKQAAIVIEDVADGDEPLSELGWVMTAALPIRRALRKRLRDDAGAAIEDAGGAAADADLRAMLEDGRGSADVFLPSMSELSREEAIVTDHVLGVAQRTLSKDQPRCAMMCPVSVVLALVSYATGERRGQRTVGRATRKS